MTRPPVAHHYASEIRPRPQAVPFHVDQRREGMRVVRDVVLATFAFAFLAVALVGWLAGGR